jgi:hypothetical protein
MASSILYANLAVDLEDDRNLLDAQVGGPGSALILFGSSPPPENAHHTYFAWIARSQKLWTARTRNVQYQIALYAMAIIAYRLPATSEPRASDCAAIASRRSSERILLLHCFFDRCVVVSKMWPEALATRKLASAE